MSRSWTNHARGHDRHYSEPPSQVGRCRNKVSYPSRRVARGVRRVMAKRGADVECLAAYRCSECGSWHLGNRWSNRRTEES